MKVKIVLSIAVLTFGVLAATGPADAALKVFLVSDAAVPVSHGGPATGNHNDDSLVEWLESIGYEVDVSGMGQACRDGGSLGAPVPGSASLAAMQAADIVFVTRRTDSGSLDDAASRLAWNGLAKPLLLNGNGAIIRGESSSTRWGWTRGAYNGDGDNRSQVNWDLTAGGSIAMFDWSTAPTAPSSPKAVAVFPIPSEIVPGHEVIATFDGADRAVWVKFPAGTNFDAGNGTTNKYGVAGERRIFFGHWGYDSNNGPGGAAGKWSDYITDEYKATLAAALTELVDQSFNPPPVADAGPDQSAYIDGSIQLAGVVTDEDPLDGSNPGEISQYWQQISGPGTANFSDITALDATVTFSAKGTYELMLQATDGDKDANDVMRVRVKDRADEFIVGHWDFEDNVIDQSINSNDGTINALNGGGYDPDAAVGSKSINLINVDPADPNMNYVDLGAAPELNFATTDWTVSGWVKTTQQKGSGEEGKGTIFGNGGDTGGGHRYCLIVSEGSNGQVTLVVDDDVTKVTVEGPTIVNDGSWHFVAGQRDGNVIRLYINGVLEGTATLPDNYDLSGTSQHNSYIGVITDHDDVAPTLYKDLDGLVDDVRVYNYALALEDLPQYDSILSLTAMGPLVATVDAGEDFVFNWRPGRETQVNGVVTDLGAPNPMTIMWSTLSGPDDAQALFANPMSAVTTVGFPTGGDYILRLTVLDEGQEVTDDVKITVNAPTCADVVADGLIWAADLDGDCYVGLSDLAMMLVNWARCNDPADTANCDWPWLE